MADPNPPSEQPQPQPPAPSTSTATATQKTSPPRITIQYCTQCKWMLRAAYFAQELLSTFSTDIGEIALVPRTGGVFTVTLFPSLLSSTSTTQGGSEPGPEPEWSREGTILWDRKRDGGFPEVKALKSLVRNVIDPGRDLGHTDRALKMKKQQQEGKEGSGATTGAGAAATVSTVAEPKTEKECEDCK
ncbi:Rdx family-domain-containing protein [Aspergillus karnatakaensis]|uniref:SelT/SelW/SelH family protein n=1 Tax=Aspergillus karnatakaensis TaxID=1810916 RepID=UPI003CCCBC15